MLLLSIVYNQKLEDIIDDINDIKEIFELKKIQLGISESIEGKNHFVKIFCNDTDYNENLENMMNLYFSNVLYKLVVERFYNSQLDKILKETYFFLKKSELIHIKKNIKRTLLSEDTIINENMIYCINRKNDIVEKIIECIKESREININGFLTFRIKDFISELECIVDKVIEAYMVEKEYNEFVKLLKYFVEVQESKIDEVNIIIKDNGEYLLQDKKGEDILLELLTDLSQTKFSGTVSMEDLIISGLITNVPKRVVIHCEDNCNNNEMLETIKNVFLDRVAFCEGCSLCNIYKNNLKV